MSVAAFHRLAFGSQTAPFVPVVALFFLLVAWFWDLGPGLDKDDFALYLLHAQAIVEGRSYTDTGFIHTSLDVAPPAQPPGLPLVLAAAALLGGGFGGAATKVAVGLMSLIAVLVPGLYFARLRGPLIGATVSAFLALVWAPRLTHAETDIGFVGLVWALLLLVDSPRDRVGWVRVSAILAVGTFAMTYRMLGAVLFPAVGWIAVAQGRRDRAVAVPLTVWAVGGALVLLAGGWSVIEPQLPGGLGNAIDRVGQRFPLYLGASVTAHLYPFAGNAANDLYHVVSMGLAVIGITSWTREHWRSAAWGFTLLYGSALLLVTAGSTRYVTPMMPVLVFGLLEGGRVLSEFAVARLGWPPPRLGRMTSIVAVLVVLSAALLRVLDQPQTGGRLLELPDTQEMLSTLVAEATGRSEAVRVAFAQPRVLTWSTGLPAMVIPNAEPDVLMADLDRGRISHVVLDELGLARGRIRQMQRTIEAYSCRFELLFSNRGFRLYRILDDCVEAR